MADHPQPNTNFSNEQVQEFVQLLTAHQGRIRSYILSLAPNFNDAEDIMQETSRMMWSRFADFEPGTDFLAWGRSIAFYRVLDHRRNRKSRQAQVFNEELLRILEREAKNRTSDRSRDYLSYLRNCVTKLMAKDRLLVRMRYEQNVKVLDIARRVGVTVQTVYRSLARVQGQLQLCIQRTARQEDLLRP